MQHPSYIVKESPFPQKLPPLWLQIAVWLLVPAVAIIIAHFVFS